MIPYFRATEATCLLLVFPQVASSASFTVAPGAARGAGALYALGAADVCTSPGNASNATFTTTAALGPTAP